MADDLWAELQAEEERSKKAHRKRIEKREELAGGSVGEFQRLMLRINATPKVSSQGRIKQQVQESKRVRHKERKDVQKASALPLVAPASQPAPVPVIERKEESKCISSSPSKAQEVKVEPKDVDSDDEEDEEEQRCSKSSEPGELLASTRKITSANVASLLQRHVNALSSEDLSERRHALQVLHEAFGVQSGNETRVKAGRLRSSPSEIDEFSLLEEAPATAIQSFIRTALLRPLLRRLSDRSEKCREATCQLLLRFCGDSLFASTTNANFTFREYPQVLAYLFPALVDRSPDCFVFDPEQNVFARSKQVHEAEKRGRVQQSPETLGGVYIHTVNEPSEEVRLLLCRLARYSFFAALRSGGQ